MSLSDGMRLLRRSNWLLTLAVGALLTIGVMFVYSACRVSDESSTRLLYQRQLAWGLLGLLCYAGLTCFDYRRLRGLSWLVYAGSLVLLVVVLLFGARIYGARRWLMVFGLGIQPSEFAKIAFVLITSAMLTRPGTEGRGFGAFLLVGALMAVPVILILKEPDLGTAMVFVPTAFAMLFVGGGSGRVLAGILVLGVAIVAFVLGALVIPAKLELPKERQERIAAMTGLSEYQRDRIRIFLEIEKDPLGAGWNKMQSEIAVGSGGPWGRGYLKGKQNLLGFLPRSVAPTDFIFSVIAEEKGFVGSVVVLGLFATVLWGIMRAAWLSVDRFGRVLCTGLATMLFAHVFINIAMTVGLMPITGVPLPLLSYGGSFMAVMMSGLGIAQSVHVRSQVD